MQHNIETSYSQETATRKKHRQDQAQKSINSSALKSNISANIY